MTLRQLADGLGPRLTYGLGGVLAAGLLVLLLVGRGCVEAPVMREVEVRVVTRETVRVEYQTRVEYRDRETTRWRTVTREVPTVVYVDGGVPQVLVLREVVQEAHRDAHSEGRAEGAGSVAADSETETHRREREVPVLPSWRLGVQVGASWVTPAVRLEGPLVLGVEASYRLPLDRLGLPPRYGAWLGAWGGTYGAAGASVALEF